MQSAHSLHQAAVPLRRVDAAGGGGGGAAEQQAPGEPRVGDDRQQAGEHADHQTDADVDERHHQARHHPDGEVVLADAPVVLQVVEHVEQRQDGDDEHAGEHGDGEGPEEGSGDQDDDEHQHAREDARHLRAAADALLH